MKQEILIIGGMGPQASLKLHEYILKGAIQNGATAAADFPAITNLSIPFPDFISNVNNRKKALDEIKRRLYRLWQTSIYTCNFGV